MRGERLRAANRAVTKGKITGSRRGIHPVWVRFSVISISRCLVCLPPSVSKGETLMRSLLKISPVLLAAAFVVSVPSASVAELAEWDQGRVTALAAELIPACDALYDTFYNEPVASVLPGQRKDYYRLRQVVRRIKLEAMHLSSALKKGEGYDETLPVYENLMVMVRDAREGAKRIFTSNFVLEKATAAGEVLQQIAPYYDSKALEGS